MRNESITWTMVDDKVEQWIEDNDLSHGNAGVDGQDGMLIVRVEGTNHTTLRFDLDNKELWKIKDNFENEEIFNLIMYKGLRSAIDRFDVDEEFNELWNYEFGEHNNFTPREFIEVLEDDERHFENVLHNLKV